MISVISKNMAVNLFARGVRVYIYICLHQYVMYMFCSLEIYEDNFEFLATYMEKHA